MSDRPIQVGDLVTVVSGHVCDIGNIFQVASIYGGPVWWGCPRCGKWEFVKEPVVQKTAVSGDPISHVKRIPPLSELEYRRTEEKLKEPA